MCGTLYRNKKEHNMKFYKTKPFFDMIWEFESGDIIKLRRNMTYFIGDKTITVPKGFSCDGASVPRFLWGLISPAVHPQTIAAAILHDYMYRNHPEGWTRYQADAIFYAISRTDGLKCWRAGLAWLGLRIFGGWAWKQKKK